MRIKFQGRIYTLDIGTPAYPPDYLVLPNKSVYSVGGWSQEEGGVYVPQNVRAISLNVSTENLSPSQIAIHSPGLTAVAS